MILERVQSTGFPRFTLNNACRHDSVSLLGCFAGANIGDASGAFIEAFPQRPSKPFLEINPLAIRSRLHLRCRGAGCGRLHGGRAA